MYMFASSLPVDSELGCPPECPPKGLGGFVQAKRTPEEILKEIKDNENKAKADVAQDESSLLSIKTPVHDEIAIGPSVQSYTIRGIKPGLDGKVDWTPLAELTGTRPVVSKYSLSRYSLDEWRNRNKKILSNDTVTDANTVDYNSKTVMMQAFGNIDKNQQENSKRLKQKAKDIFRWKKEVEEACRMMTAEVVLLENERQRIKAASRTLMLPESISKECLELRANRAVPDLVADLAEQELLKEMKLVNEIRAILGSTVQKIEEQLAINKAAKHRLEYDWSDKYVAYNTEAINLGLSAKSNTILFQQGAVKYAENTAPLEYWEYLCRQNIEDCESVRQNSVDLRSTLNAILTTNGNMLRTQADITDSILAETVAITTELCTKLEESLRATLQKIADIEILIQNLQDAVRKTDAAMKLAQTRLDNRNNGRPHGEAVRDLPHTGLIDEVKVINETATSLLCQLKNAERVRKELINKRIELEREIAAKRKTLNIDRHRCGMVRSHYPSAAQLAGLNFKYQFC